MLIKDSVYDSISQMVQIALMENQSQVIDSSPLLKAGIKSHYLAATWVVQSLKTSKSSYSIYYIG
jgi:hypothetical protein